ncbi:glutaredoxin family protein [Desulfitobacterium metallireducens]|uniref:glutaredoxin family protein n=1 Tax=Desulfitobacterium metallireducens TaxID=142877 RepID=UPI00249E8469|nr:glutaredoxin family protein [Desulfitobacterium metallireducens]
MRAKRFLKGKGIKWVEKNIIVPAHRKEMGKITNAQSVPVVQVGNQVLVGFSAQEYEETFKEWGLDK